MARALFPYATALRICMCVYSALLASWKTLTFLSCHEEARDNILLTHLLRHRNVSNTNISGNEA